MPNRKQNPVIGYFQFDEESSQVAVVLKTFWEQHHVLDDSGSEESSLPNNFYQVAEAIYEHGYPSDQDAKDALIAQGFEERALFGA